MLVQIQFLVASGRMTDDLSKLNSDEKLMVAMFLTALDKTGTHSFGDKIIVPAENCNVLEFVFTVDGQDWTWKNQ